jgi:hypothetical protein
MKITEALWAEHLVFHNMFDHLEAAVPKLKTLAEVQGLAALMESMLRDHSDIEDALFLGPLDHCFEQIGQRDAFLEEHREIDQNLDLVRQAAQVGQARKRLLAAVAYSRRHFDKEERIVFPMAERLLKAKTLTELAKTWMDQRMGNSGVTRIQAAPPALRNVSTAALTPVTSAATRAASVKSEGASRV